MLPKVQISFQDIIRTARVSIFHKKKEENGDGEIKIRALSD